MYRHIRPIGDASRYLTAGFISESHPVPDGYEIVEGYPPEEAIQIEPSELEG